MMLGRVSAVATLTCLLASSVSAFRIQTNPIGTSHGTGHLKFVSAPQLASRVLAPRTTLFASHSPNDEDYYKFSTLLNGMTEEAGGVEYLTEQSNLYFDTLQTDVSGKRSHPNYSPGVARWEWPPWLLLTGLNYYPMIATDVLSRIFFPEVVSERIYKIYDDQPFGRGQVKFTYYDFFDREKITGEYYIYEEFTFNAQGEMTWIEAWSSAYNFTEDSPKCWDQGSNRLSTLVPGLGNPSPSAIDKDKLNELSDSEELPAETRKNLKTLIKCLDYPVLAWCYVVLLRKIQDSYSTSQLVQIMSSKKSEIGAAMKDNPFLKDELAGGFEALKPELTAKSPFFTLLTASNKTSTEDEMLDLGDTLSKELKNIADSL